MKRLVFCFDGTWNRLDAKNVTNVVHTAQNIAFLDDKGISQIVHYDQGVGTKPHEKLRGGLFGMGLMDNLEEAYQFLVFNYDPGDEIYLFGFSRGAFSARTFAGLIFNCGIVNDVKKIPKALKLYKTRAHDDQHMLAKFRDFRLECSPQLCVDQKEFDWRVQSQNCLFRPINLKATFDGLSDLMVPDLRVLNIKYIGVWDTVGALGVPKTMSVASVVNRRHEFHDCNLSAFVASARHAVAIDEKRRSFEPTLWANVDEMNESIGFAAETEEAPYQQQWFPGVHGAVGGGGDHTGLSDEALEWVWDGAKRLGLQFSTTRSSSIYKIAPDHTDHLKNVDPPKWYQLKRRVAGMLPKQPRSFVKDKTSRKKKRDIRPIVLHQLSVSTRYRWKAKAEDLRSKEIYRPKLTLDHVTDILQSWDMNAAVSDDVGVAPKPKKDGVETKGASLTHTVVREDTLSRIAKQYYGDSAKYPIIFEANQPMLTSEDRIYPGQVLVIPPLT